MKPIITWIVLADAKTMRIAVNEGPGKGLYGRKTEGVEPAPVTALSDAPGMTNAPMGPNRGGISDPDLKGQAEAAFASDIVSYLAGAMRNGEFDRLVLVAAPEMLGLLRERLSTPLQEVLRADLPKDLTHVTLDDLPKHLEDVMVV